jgi:hypothetical protein
LEEASDTLPLAPRVKPASCLGHGFLKPPFNVDLVHFLVLARWLYQKTLDSTLIREDRKELGAYGIL